MNNYNFSVNTSSAFDVSMQEKKLVEISPVKDKVKYLNIDGKIDSIYIDAEVKKDSAIDVSISNYIKNRTTKIFSISSSDTTDINGAVSTINTNFIVGDMIVINNPDTDTLTGYVFTKEGKWIAFSGNSGAGNTVFTKDILCAGNYTQVGNVTKSASGTYTIPAKGKTVEEIMTSIFTQELQPTKTEPSVSINFPQSGSKEVGTTITPSYVAILNTGSYTYGPATGVAASAWSVTDGEGNSSDKSSDSFASFVVGDSTNYKITATATHTEGSIAVSNIGNNSNPVVKIAAGTKTKTSGSVTGYRAFFYGALATDSSTPLTSNIIRGLTNGGAYNGSKSLTINPITNGKRYIIAIPKSSTRSGLTSAILPNSLNAEVKTQYLTETISVEGKDGFTAVDYKVYVYEPASIGGNEIHKITLG